ncbi:MAG: hypothetical protein OEW75_00865 [Cyclobacteriaceae bacterium]|nr:hypothetical protein [Cyclobacteriaceae bacterium]
MSSLFVIIFLGTLFYLALSVNVKNYINLIGIQGLLLFGIAIFELHELNVVHLILILAETLIFKGIIVPGLLYRISKRNKISVLKNNKTHRKAKGFNMVIITALVIGLSFVFSHNQQDAHLEIQYFTAAISAMIMGILFITVNKNIIIHLISFLVIENGIFLMAIAVGSNMPMLVNAAILLDIFSSVLVLTVFLNRIGQFFQDVETDQLTELKD